MCYPASVCDIGLDLTVRGGMADGHRVLTLNGTPTELVEMADVIFSSEGSLGRWQLDTVRLARELNPSLGDSVLRMDGRSPPLER